LVIHGFARDAGFSVIYGFTKPPLTSSGYPRPLLFMLFDLVAVFFNGSSCVLRSFWEILCDVAVIERSYL